MGVKEISKVNWNIIEKNNATWNTKLVYCTHILSQIATSVLKPSKPCMIIIMYNLMSNCTLADSNVENQTTPELLKLTI